MIEIKPIRVTDYLDIAEKLTQAHWQECEAGIVPEGLRLNKALIAALDAAGAALTMGVFNNELLVGYSLTLVAPHLHYDMVNAHCDSIFLMRPYRHGGLGHELVMRTAEEAKARGAHSVSFNAKPGSAFEKLLRRITGSNTPEDTVWTWRL